ncbi:MAG: hypothetical protein A2017_11230 [Lentisphaerae bacterium GWF2_44_16]|nr:MAG: hypothetical protein A2017_11230 [Lentisphaerae bacterium GWF2_44_16]
MIISFSVSNFRSIKDKLVLNMEAGSMKEYPGNLSEFNNGKLRILRTAGIHGANASGKSNVIKAFEAFQEFIRISDSLKQDDPITVYDPFRLDDESVNLPTAFELDFMGLDKIRYIYGFKFTATRIIEEYLYFYPKNQKALLFHRENPTDNENHVNPGEYLDGKSKSISCLKNQLFLSCVVNENGVSDKLRNLYRYVSSINTMDERRSSSSLDLLKNEFFRKKLSALLSFADFGIDHISIKEIDTSKIKLPDDMPEELKRTILEKFKIQPLFFHGESKNAFELKDESGGTRRVYELAPVLFKTLSDGTVLLFDELDVQLHPYIAELIIKLFNDPEVNTGNAQLIYTTHNINLLNSDYMRRDQLLFTQKDSYGVTELYAMDEFKVRKDIDFARWYMDGRFDALPQIRYQELKDILNEVENGKTE